MKTLAERISEANGVQAWQTVRDEQGEDRWTKLAEKRAAIQAACSKAAEIAAANPRIARLMSLPGLTAQERALVDTRLAAHG